LVYFPNANEVRFDPNGDNEKRSRAPLYVKLHTRRCVRSLNIGDVLWRVAH